MSIFSKRVTQLRKDRGWSQEELAQRMGVTRSAIGNWEQGTREPDYVTLERVADLFNCEMQYLIGEKPASDLSLDERYIIEYMRSDAQFKDRLMAYAKFLAKEGNL